MDDTDRGELLNGPESTTGVGLSRTTLALLLLPAAEFGKRRRREARFRTFVQLLASIRALPRAATPTPTAARASNSYIKAAATGRLAAPRAADRAPRKDHSSSVG